MVAREGRQQEPLDRLASASRSPEELIQVLRELTGRLDAAEEARHHLLAERDMLRHRAGAELAELKDHMASLDAERRMLQNALGEAERRFREAERTAEVLNARTAQAMAALVQAKEELAAARAREAARTERIKSRRALPDADGYERLRPEPLRAQTAADLIEALRQFRTWAGNPSFRDMALRSGRRAGASTMCTLLGGGELPDRLEVIDAIVEGCGGTDEDRQKFATAWRRLAMPGHHTAERPSVAEPRLRIIPASGAETGRRTG